MALPLRDTLPSPKLNACMSLYLLNVVIAVRKRNFHVKYLSGAKGSNGGFFSIFKTKGKSHSGNKLLVCGLELKLPFNSLIM